MSLLNKFSSLKLFLNDWMDSGLNYAKGIRYFRRHYMTGNPVSIDEIYRDEKFPTYLEVEVTTVCNLKCKICEHTYWDEKSRHMPLEKFKYIINQFPEISWIGLTGIGESFLHPDFFEMVKIVKDRKAYLELYDTFYFIDEESARKLISAPCDRLLISLDAATAETYHKQRIGSDFERVTSNLRRMFQLREQMHSRKPELEFHFIVNSLNIHEMLPFIHLAKDISGGGDTKVVFSRMLHFYKETEDLFTEIPDDMKEKTLAEGRKAGIAVAWNADSVSIKPPCTMCSAWTMPFIFVTGEVIPCCSSNESNSRKRQKELSMGNIFENTMEEIWNGEKYKDLRAKLYKGIFPDACKECCLYREGSHRN